RRPRPRGPRLHGSSSGARLASVHTARLAPCPLGHAALRLLLARRHVPDPLGGALVPDLGEPADRDHRPRLLPARLPAGHWRLRLLALLHVGALDPAQYARGSRRHELEGLLPAPTLPPRRLAP